MGWPFGNTQTGGLNERKFFLHAITTERFSQPIDKFSFQTPHQALEINERDIVIFDQRMLHCVEEVSPVTPRMLCTALFTANPETVERDPFIQSICEVVQLSMGAPLMPRQWIVNSKLYFGPNEIRLAVQPMVPL